MTTYYDVFNGDADGILSLVQLRQVEPRASQLITGVKRDINLLKNVPVSSEQKHITVLDVSMEKNMESLLEHLHTGSKVKYVDHHRCGEIPDSDNLSAHIDLNADACTALIVDQLLQGQKHQWAIAAAYGDNLTAVGDKLCQQAGLSKAQSEQLRALGVLVNYNGYGETLADLHYDPAELFQLLLAYPTPFDCIADETSPFHVLQGAYMSDQQKAESARVVEETDLLLAIELDDAPWARRISGVHGNELANQHPTKAIVVMSKNKDNSLRVSLRAPLNDKRGAGDICANYATGGGRAAAAGINQLPQAQMVTFLQQVTHYYQIPA